VFGVSFIALPDLKAAEHRRQAAKRPDQCKLHFDTVNDQPESHFPGVREAGFGFSLHIG
jgi:hypothetical protein